MIALLADSQNTPIRMAWAGWPQAGWNHAGRGSVPTQEAKFPVSLRAFHVSWLIVRNSAAEVEESSRCFREFTIDEIKSGKRFHQVLSREVDRADM